MITRIINSICSTDSLPVVGGSIGALSQINGTFMLPPFEVLIYTSIVAAVGAVVGYLVKLLLDHIIIKINNNKGPKTEYR